MNKLALKIKMTEMFKYSSGLYEKIRGGGQRSKIITSAMIAVCTPYAAIKYGVLRTYEKIIGRRIVADKLKADMEKTYRYETAIVCIIKNEAAYIQEWIEYHKIVCGVGKFYLYDNESTDNVKEILKPYIEDGVVEYIWFPGKFKQLEAYNDALEKYKNQCRWMCFLDADEFIRTKNGATFPKILYKITQKKGNSVGVVPHWYMYGSSYLQKKPNDLVIKSYVNRGEDNFAGNYNVKTICNPRFIKRFISPHYAICKIGAYLVDEEGTEFKGMFAQTVSHKYLVINHYFHKSIEEAQQKLNRGKADKAGKRNWKEFQVYDVNDIFDDDLAQYAERIKASIDKVNKSSKIEEENRSESCNDNI